MPSGSDTQASAIPATACRTIDGALRRTNPVVDSSIPPANRSAHRAASGTSASARALASSSGAAGRWSSSASTRSAASTATAMTRCRSADTIGSAVVAQRNAIRASRWASSPVIPITDGISRASRCRPASEV